MLVKYNPKGEHSEFLTKYKIYSILITGYDLLVISCDDGIQRTFPRDDFTIIPNMFKEK